MPIREFTHVADLDNAFATFPFETIDIPNTKASFNPQIVVGNGETTFYPLSSSEIIAHELGHLFTFAHSNLIYANQSGAINEAYSDISGATFNNFIDQQYPWYGFSWEIGASITLPSGSLAGRALRYMNNPPLDGHSINNAAEFVPGMDVHYSSGVYNYAFYLMVTQFGINIINAFQYFSYANVSYWPPNSDYNRASCGVMQAAIDQGSQADYLKIVSAFASVGVKCKVGADKLAYKI
jgi:pseudolysin